MLTLKHMTITWYGCSCFKIVNAGGQLTIITDPFDKKIGLNPPRGSADIITLSHGKTSSKDSFVADGPGEYVIKGIGIKSISGFLEFQEKKLNTIHIIDIDRIKICHLGDFGQKQLTDKQIEEIGQIDILMVPVGGKDVLNASQAAKAIEKIEPRVVIPMSYKLSGLKIDLNDLSGFLEEMGISEKEAVNKFSLKKKDLTSGKTEIMVMKP